jgi:hypothetical protein
MTTFTNFVPTTVSPFLFSPELDGEVYSAVITWSLFGQRFYLNLYAPDGSLTCCRAVVGSPTGIALQALSWANGRAIATTVNPHGYKIGSTVGLTISGCSPDAFNGLVPCLITGPSAFSWPIAADPGAATVLGMVAYNINLIGGLLDVNGDPFTSTLVFREQANQFETSE